MQGGVPSLPRSTGIVKLLRAHCPETRASARLRAAPSPHRATRTQVAAPVSSRPVAALMEKAAGERLEARWIEIHDAALILEATRTLRPIGGTVLDAQAMERLRAEWVAGAYPSKQAAGRAHGVSDVVVGRILRGEQSPTPSVDDAAHAHVLVALFLLTGCRFREVAGLELDNVSFDRKTITVRPNGWRRLKTRTSHRVIPLWPQLEVILRAWVFGPRLERGGSLLVPSWAPSGAERPLRDIHRMLDRVAVRAGLAAGELRSKAFRHTYCAARLQTLDRGDSGEPLHGFSGTRPRLGRDGAPGLLAPRGCAPPFRGGQVPCGAASQSTRRSASAAWAGARF